MVVCAAQGQRGVALHHSEPFICVCSPGCALLTWSCLLPATSARPAGASAAAPRVALPPALWSTGDMEGGGGPEEHAGAAGQMPARLHSCSFSPAAQHAACQAALCAHLALLRVSNRLWQEEPRQHGPRRRPAPKLSGHACCPTGSATARRGAATCGRGDWVVRAGLVEATAPGRGGGTRLVVHAAPTGSHGHVHPAHCMWRPGGGKWVECQTHRVVAADGSASCSAPGSRRLMASAIATAAAWMPRLAACAGRWCRSGAAMLACAFAWAATGRAALQHGHQLALQGCLAGRQGQHGWGGGAGLAPPPLQ